jgi:Mg/Co/Ni transporter MgtE
MSKQLSLTLAYLEHAPRAAAQVLQNFKVEEIASFFETVPARSSAPVINYITPWAAAQCIELISPVRAAAIINIISIHESISLLRLMDGEKYESIFEELPTKLAKRLRNALKYPISQVGAWIDPAIPILSEQDTVQHALKLLRESASANHVFVESEENGKYMGVITVKNLLQYDIDLNLSLLPIKEIEPVSARASLSTLNLDSRWDHFLYLPVVGHKDNILGGLSRGVLRNYMHRQREIDDDNGDNLLGYLLDAIFITTAGIIKLIFNNEKVSLKKSRRNHERTN